MDWDRCEIYEVRLKIYIFFTIKIILNFKKYAINYILKKSEVYKFVRLFRERLNITGFFDFFPKIFVKNPNF